MTYTKEQLNSINLRAGRFDMTQIPRLRTDFTEADNVYNYQALNALNAKCNENSERVEDLWIELDLQLIDQMEEASKKLQNRNRKQQERDNRNHVASLHKQGFSLAEIASITKLDHETVYNYAHRPHLTKNTSTRTREGVHYGKDPELHRELYGAFDDCPEDIKADLDEWDV